MREETGDLGLLGKEKKKSRRRVWGKTWGIKRTAGSRHPESHGRTRGGDPSFLTGWMSMHVSTLEQRAHGWLESERGAGQASKIVAGGRRWPVMEGGLDVQRLASTPHP
jgi:hypothetical protein